MTNSEENIDNCIYINMFRIFNCGIGMVLIVKEEDSKAILKEIKDCDFNCFKIGKLINREANSSVVFK